jgi:hypothetical protein
LPDAEPFEKPVSVMLRRAADPAALQTDEQLSWLGSRPVRLIASPSSWQPDHISERSAGATYGWLPSGSIPREAHRISERGMFVVEGSYRLRRGVA